MGCASTLPLRICTHKIQQQQQQQQHKRASKPSALAMDSTTENLPKKRGERSQPTPLVAKLCSYFPSLLGRSRQYHGHPAGDPAIADAYAAAIEI